nr:MAG TPA: hypothetical protein [Caudoviricetes sp.]
MLTQSNHEGFLSYLAKNVDMTMPVAVGEG